MYDIPPRPAQVVPLHDAKIVPFPLERATLPVTLVDDYLSAVAKENTLIEAGVEIPADLLTDIGNAYDRMAGIGALDGALEIVETMLARNSLQASYAAAELVGGYLIDGIVDFADVTDAIGHFLTHDEECVVYAGARAVTAAKKRLQPNDELGRRRLSNFVRTYNIVEQ